MTYNRFKTLAQEDDDDHETRFIGDSIAEELEAPANKCSCQVVVWMTSRHPAMGQSVWQITILLGLFMHCLFKNKRRGLQRKRNQRIYFHIS